MIEHIFVGGMSRTGTTLLTTILDSHPAISMGYEMLPANLPEAAECARLLAEAADACEDDAGACRKQFQQAGHASLAGFVKRSSRCEVSPRELSGLFAQLAEEGHRGLDSLPLRARISDLVVQQKRRKEATQVAGFKLNVPSIEPLLKEFPQGFYAFVVRDPRDVVASHFKRDFGRSLEDICKAWVNYYTHYEKFVKQHGECATIVRYEDLVTRADEVLRELFAHAGIEFDDAVLRFYDSEASIHRHNHANAEQLRQNFFTSSMGRWVTELTGEQIEQIDRACRPLAERFGYFAAPSMQTISLSAKETSRIEKYTSTRKKLYRNQYGELLEPYRNEYVNLTLDELAEGRKARGSKVVIIRHDIDHDIDTAVKMAEWEQANGWRSTFCVLHTAGYYGGLKHGRMWRSREMLEGMKQIQSLGHEVNLHNNIAVLALTHGVDPARFLEEELTFLRHHGLKIVGTATHGDKLCRELDFRNFELFADRPWPSRGGPRVVEYKGNRVELGSLEPERFGLTYEAYDFPRDFYITDSGGKLRTRTDTRGQAGQLRRQMDAPPPYPFIAGALFHPVWWDFDRDAPADAQLLSPEAA